MKFYYFDEDDEEYKECAGNNVEYNKEYIPSDSNVEHPGHYKGTDSLECIDVIQFSFGIDGFIYYCAGNVLKYLWRYNNKNGKEDIKKAKQYLDIMGDLSTHMSAQAYDIYSRSLWLYKRSVDDKNKDC